MQKTPKYKLRDPFVPCGEGNLYWSTLQENEYFSVQKYNMGVFGFFIRNLKNDEDPRGFRIITKGPLNSEVIVADCLEDIMEAWEVVVEVVSRRLTGLKKLDIQEVLPHLFKIICSGGTVSTLNQYIEDLWRQKIQKDEVYNLFQFTYVEPLEQLRTFYPLLICPTCTLPAVEPISYIQGPNKIFCKTCFYAELKMPDLTEKSKIDLIQSVLKPVEESILEQLDLLKVWCPYACYGCDFVCYRKDVSKHSYECPKKRYLCIHQEKGCTFSSSSAIELQEHINLCNSESLVYSKFGHALKGVIFPTDVLVQGMYYLNLKDVMSVSMVNKRLHHICFSSIKLWEYFCKRDDLVGSNCTIVNSKDKNIWLATYKSSYGKCGRCGISHKQNNLPRRYHPGKWHSFTYKELLQGKESAAVVAHKVLDGTSFVAQLPITMVKKGGNIFLQGIMWGAGGASLALRGGKFFGPVGAVGGAAVGISILTVCAAGGAFFGITKMVLYPFFETHKVIRALNRKENVSTTVVFGLEKWSCCGAEGSWARGCQLCTEFVPNSC